MSGVTGSLTAWQQGTDDRLETGARREHVERCSPYAAHQIARHPKWLDALDAAGRLDGGPGPGAGELTSDLARRDANVALRRFRNREMLRIIWRDLCGLANLGETLNDLTTLAEVCVEAAIEVNRADLERRFGRPMSADGEPQRIVVIGMGKLGGRELNLSSDIDVIFGFEAGGQCDGPGRLDNGAFFTRLARAAIANLSEVTEDGFCFRVDTRLRPFGQAGPLVASFNAMEQYYQREGRDWERYALIKARPVAGDRAAGHRLLDALAPFVYRRYIDFGAVEALQEMHASIQADARRTERVDDLKRGPGGIREIEFLAQTFQLLRGGRETGLRTHSLAEALDRIESLDLIRGSTAEQLRSDYTFLRKLENRVQALHDQQVHALPAGEDLDRVVRAMRLPDPASLESELHSVRERVSDRFRAMFPALPEPGDTSRWTELWQRMRDDLQATDDGGSGSAVDFMRRLQQRSPSDRARRRLDRFMPVLLDRIDRRELDEATLDRVFDLVLSIVRRSGYLVLLVQHAEAVDRLLDLFDSSRWVADLVIRYPALLDELIDPSLGQQIPDDESLAAATRRIMAISGDAESRLDALNNLKQATMLRIAVAQLRGGIASDAVLSALTSLADAMVAAVLELAADEIHRRHGALYPGESAQPAHGLAVIGYGTLGARELGYGSDLDLVFLFRDSDRRSDGARPLDAGRWYARLAQRMLSFLTTITASGRLYEVDTRLRPNGRAGALVSSIGAFRAYQERDAWLWERQALTRARFVAGDVNVGILFQDVRRAALARPADPDEVAKELAAMRKRIREAHRDERESPKHRAGGLVDIEFVAQMGVLISAADYPELLAHTDTSGQIRALGQVAWLDADAVETLLEALGRWRQASQMDVLVGPGATFDAEMSMHATDVARICGSLLGDAIPDPTRPN
jgi:glutamate-ammonia-ligase adenylyltransferase